MWKSRKNFPILTKTTDKKGVAIDKEATSLLSKKKEGTAVELTTPFSKVIPQKEGNVKKKDAGLWQTIKNAVMKILKKWGVVIDAYKDKHPEAAEAGLLEKIDVDFKKLQKMFAEAFADASDTYNAVGNLDTDEGGGTKEMARDRERAEHKDNDFTYIKEQLKGALDMLSKTDPVTSIKSLDGTTSKEHRKAIIRKELKQKGTVVDRQNFGKILIDDTALSYAYTNAEISSFRATHAVLKRGIEIAVHGKHKSRAFGTVTFGAKITIDGEPAVVGVVVKQTSGNKLKAQRVLSITGENLKLSARANTKAEATYGKMTDVSIGESLPITSASGKIIQQGEPFVKNKLSDRGKAPTFYSKMGRVIDDIKTEKVGADSLVSYLKGKGVKDEEIKWSGIQTFLSGKKSVTKAELQEFIAGSQLQIEEEEFVNTARWEEYKLDGGENYRELVFRMPNSNYRNKAMAVHWGEKGVLAHTRLQDFTDVGGKKVLFIEELQSDWHNEGNKRGYASEALSAAQKQKLRDQYEKLGDEKADITHKIESLSRWTSKKNAEKIALLRSELSRIKAEQESIQQQLHTVPDAPFRKTYHEYVLKRLLRMAAEGGYDSIAWTPADMQSKRWSDEYAEGYRIEYDQDIPKFLNKYGKQWGAKVGSTDINGNGVWSFDITDTMRESVLYEGQPKYSDRDQSYLQVVSSGDMQTAQRMVDEEAEKYLAQSKIREKNGKLRKVYHGTNSGEFYQFDKRLSGSANDAGWYGKGFYFAFTKGEASYYGSRVMECYLNIENPFVYDDELGVYDGVSSGDVLFDFAAFVINMAEKFPDIANGLKISVTEQFNEFGEADSVKEKTFIEFAEELKSVYNNKRLAIQEIYEGDRSHYEYVVTDDLANMQLPEDVKKVIREEGIDSASWAQYLFKDGRISRKQYDDVLDAFEKYGELDFRTQYVRSRFDDKKTAEKYRLSAALSYLSEKKYGYVEQHIPEYFMARIADKFSAEVKRRGYDGILQSIEGDEVVAFEENQIKSADPVTYDDNGNVIPLSERFDSSRKDIRYSDRNSYRKHVEDIDTFDIEEYYGVNISGSEFNRLQSEAMTWDSDKAGKILRKTLSNGYTYFYSFDSAHDITVYKKIKAKNIHERKGKIDDYRSRDQVAQEDDRSRSGGRTDTYRLLGSDERTARTGRSNAGESSEEARSGVRRGYAENGDNADGQKEKQIKLQDRDLVGYERQRKIAAALAADKAHLSEDVETRLRALLDLQSKRTYGTHPIH